MNMQSTRHPSAGALFRLGAAMQASGRALRAAAKRLDALLERRRVAAAALEDFATMSERDFRDIGLTPVDVDRVAWGASDSRS